MLNTSMIRNDAIFRGFIPQFERHEIFHEILVCHDKFPRNCTPAVYITRNGFNTFIAGGERIAGSSGSGGSGQNGFGGTSGYGTTGSARLNSSNANFSAQDNLNTTLSNYRGTIKSGQ